MKELLNQYAAYNLWANERLLNVALSLTDEQQQQLVESSFNSLHKTFLHLWDAESMWWQRIKLHENIISPSTAFNPSMKETATGLLNQSKEWKEWVENVKENMLHHEFKYYNTKREYFKNTIWQTLQHVFNHGTYHRGQVVNILHQLKVEKIPVTDFIAYVRLPDSKK